MSNRNERRVNVGRPSKLSPTVRERLLGVIRLGGTREAAAASAGIGRTTLHRWLARGREQTRGEYRDFWNDVQEADGVAQAILMGRINTASLTKDWRAAAWILERRWPKKYGRSESRKEQERTTEVVFQLEIPAVPHPEERGTVDPDNPPASSHAPLTPARRRPY